MKTVACIIARTVSTRLPLKVLRNVDQHCRMLDYIMRRVKFVNNIDAIYLCTSAEAVDDVLEDVAADNGVSIYRGSADAVIERMIAVGDIEKADNLIRITGDDVFTSYEVMENQIKLHNSNNLEYSRIIDVPIGATAEVMRLSALKKCYASIDPAISEYLMLYMFDPSTYRCGVININGVKESSNYTVTVDTPADLARTRKILEYYKGDKLRITLKEIIEIAEKYDIDDIRVNAGSSIKLPYGKIVSYEEFHDDMANRIKNSEHFMIR